MIEGLQNCITFMCLYLPIQACESLMRHIVVCAQSVRIEKYQCVCHCNITTQSYGAHKRCHFVKMMTLFVTPVSRCTVGVDGQKVRHSKALELRNRSYNTDLKSPYLKSRDAGSNPNPGATRAARPGTHVLGLGVRVPLGHQHGLRCVARIVPAAHARPLQRAHELGGLARRGGAAAHHAAHIGHIKTARRVVVVSEGTAS